MANKRQKKKRRKAHGLCALCGKKMSSDPAQRVVGRTGQMICVGCLKVSRVISQLPVVKAEKKEASPERDIITPGEMVKELDKAIIGQDRAKRAVAVVLWKQQLRAKGIEVPNSGLLLYGPTGCGKTALVREASRIAGLPVITADATSLSETGYRGRDAKDIIIDLADRYGAEKARYGVVFLDEIDKLAACPGNEYRASYQRGTQHSLLRLIEGTELRIDGEPFSTEGILFLFGGAFTRLRETMEAPEVRPVIGFERIPVQRKREEREPEPADFVGHGMEAELMGRISRCVPLRALTAEDMRRILLESELSVFRKYQRFFRNYGQRLELEDELVEELTRNAQERGMGARGLNALVEEWVEPRLFRLAEGA